MGAWIYCSCSQIFFTSNVSNIFLHYNVTAPCHRLNKIFSTLHPPWSDGHPFPPGRSEFIVNLSLNNSTKLEPAHSDENSINNPIIGWNWIVFQFTIIVYDRLKYLSFVWSIKYFVEKYLLNLSLEIIKAGLVNFVTLMQFIKFSWEFLSILLSRLFAQDCDVSFYSRLQQWRECELQPS